MNMPVALLLMFAIRNSVTNSFPLLSFLPLCNDIGEGKRQNKVAQEKVKYSLSIGDRGIKINQPSQLLYP